MEAVEGGPCRMMVFLHDENKIRLSPSLWFLVWGAAVCSGWSSMEDYSNLMVCVGHSLEFDLGEVAEVVGCSFSV